MSRLRIIRKKDTPKKIRIKRIQSRYWSVHTHSKFSAKDALPSVDEVVDRAKELGYRGLGLTDHGNMAGTVQLYNACKKAGIKPFPGTEFYIVKNRKDAKAKRYHTTIVAFTTQGYRNLIHLNTRSHHQFHHKPLLDLADLAELSEQGRTEGLAIMTGCYFGLVIQTLVQDGYDAAKRVVAAYAQWFSGSTYVEIQNHNINHEDGESDLTVSMQLELIADDLGLPMIVAQDSHYTRPEHKEEHESLKQLVAFGPEVDDAVFPGDGFHMVGDDWMESHHDPRRLAKGLAGLDELLAKHTLTIPELDKYDYFVPFTVAEPEQALYERCSAALHAKGLGKKGEYWDRLNHEMEIIKVSRMAGYLMLVAEVTDYCTENEIFFQARGSAAGSLLCWLLGITPVDPLKWGLLMERFLSKDRTKPPDIDLDVEHDRRDELIEWLSERFVVSQIGTWSKLSLAGDEEGKGSLRVQYLSTLRKKGIDPDWSKVTPEDRVMLDKLSDMEIYRGPGTHAAGLLLTTTQFEMDSMVPMMCIVSGKEHKYVSQYDMHDVEQLGLVKLDALGLKTLSVLRQTVLNLKRKPSDGLDFIPLSDRKTFAMISRGDTDGMFQLSGGTAARGMRELKPTKVKDIIASMALYRPATMQSGATDAYVARKHGHERTPKRHKIIANHTRDTYGILLYQEQVIGVLRDLGLDPDELTRFLKAVKASNGNIGDAAGVIGDMLGHIKDLCRDNGMDEADIRWLEEALEAYAGYGFNAAHSVVYGITAYRSAYLAANHPVEYHSALLAVAAGSDKEKEYVRVTLSRGVRLLSADVNYSGVTYAMDPKGRGVRRGLLSIKGVGEKACDEITLHQPYFDLEDFVTSVTPRLVSGVNNLKPYVTSEAMAQALEYDEPVGIVWKLYEAGALSSLIKE